MKAIKIILSSISLIIVVFLLTGLFVKKTDYSVQVSINKPLEVVFETFTNVKNVKNWIPEIISIDVLEENIAKTGSVYKIVIENKGQEITMTEKIMAYIPNEKITLFFDAENMLKKDDYTFSETDGVSTVTLNASCQSDSYIMACIFPYFKGTFKAQDQSYLNNFKEFIESKN
ncbi:SRPBCC family protein [uncultured Polaribacter sp.]|uniref:SRPBCC family protein n=1 Tax=uncultured Polaribacter sp. TaxID=174711 RepID=UPI00262505A6|nr:SRPBCC family protein [uncultured Polaribacter sp.]